MVDYDRGPSLPSHRNRAGCKISKASMIICHYYTWFVKIMNHLSGMELSVRAVYGQLAGVCAWFSLIVFFSTLLNRTDRRGENKK